MNPNLKYTFFSVRRGEGGGARVCEFFSKNPNVKKKYFFLGRGGGGGRQAGGGGRGGARVSDFFPRIPI